MESLALVDRSLTRRDLDSRRPRSHPRWIVRRNSDPQRDTWTYGQRSRRKCDVLSRGRGDRRDFLWLRNGSLRPKEIVLYHGRRLSPWHRSVGAIMEFCQLRYFPCPDRRRDWRNMLQSIPRLTN